MNIIKFGMEPHRQLYGMPFVTKIIELFRVEIRIFISCLNKRPETLFSVDTRLAILCRNIIHLFRVEIRNLFPFRRSII